MNKINRANGFYRLYCGYRFYFSCFGKIKFFSLLFFYVLNIYCQNKILDKIKIYGSKTLAETYITNSLSVFSGDLFNPDTLYEKINTIKKIYFKNGYYDTEIDSITFLYKDSIHVDVNIYIKEGKQIIFSKVIFEGVDDSEIRILSRYFSSFEKDIYKDEYMERSIENIIYHYKCLGFPFVKVKVTDLNIRRENNVCMITINLFIEKGELVKINEIRIKGNETTKDFVIVRECGINLGDFYNQKLIDRIGNKLQHLDIFKNVSEPFLSFHPNGGVLNLNVVEANNNFFDGIVGYQPSGATNEKGYFTGMIDIALKNLFGTGRKFKIYWLKESINNQQINLNYFEPWIFSLPINISLNFKERRQDSTFVKRDLECSSEFSLFDQSVIKVSLDYENVIPGSEKFINSSFNNNRSYSIGEELILDTRDDLNFPENGLFISNKIQIGNKSYLSGNADKANKSVRKYFLTFEWYNSLFNNQTFYFSLNGELLNTQKIEYSDMFFLGGMRSIRGYKENQFFGTKIIWSNIEYRLKLEKGSYIYPLLDLGYFYRPNTIDGFLESSTFLCGYGIGINLDTAIGIIKVNFALGKDDTFSQGKIHFGFMNRF